MNCQEEWGRWVESAIGAYLLNNSLTKHYQLYYWRHGNHEVVFVLEYKDRIIGIEVKSGSADSTSGMGAFTRQYQPERVILVGNAGIPWQEFLSIDLFTLF